MTGRVGVAAEKRKVASFVKVSEETEKPKFVIEELAPDDNALYDVSMVADVEIKTENVEIEDAVKIEEEEVLVTKEVCCSWDNEAKINVLG